MTAVGAPFDISSHQHAPLHTAPRRQQDSDCRTLQRRLKSADSWPEAAMAACSCAERVGWQIPACIDFKTHVHLRRPQARLRACATQHHHQTAAGSKGHPLLWLTDACSAKQLQYLSAF